MPKVLVLDANQRSALAVIRSLGRRGLDVIAGDHQRRPLGAASRYATASVLYPNPAMSPREFIGEIISAARRLSIDTIIPATDLTTMLLVSQPDLSRITRLAAPSAESYEALTDKARLIQLAGSLGIPIPVTRIAKTASEARDAAHDIGFPVVLKPSRSRYLKGQRIASTTVQIAEDADALSEALQPETWIDDIPCLVQSFISGHGAGIFSLYGPNGPMAWFAHRRIREKPPTGGVSVLSESTAPDPVMQAYAAKLLSASAWTGAAMVEFRIGDDGVPYLMEVNGRFWGSLQLAIDCGIDFPWLLHQAAHASDDRAPQSYAVGRRLRWLLGDLDSLLITLRSDRLSLRAKRSSLIQFLHSFTDMNCHQEVFRITDPHPGLREIAHWFRSLGTSI